MYVRQQLDMPTYTIPLKKYDIVCETIGSAAAIYQNISCRQGDTREVRHLFCILKARGVRSIDLKGG